jgi:hypothetical protein
MQACRKVNDDMKDREFPNCYRIRKVYRETFQKENPKNHYYEMASGCGGTGGVRRSLLGEIECSVAANRDRFDMKINAS